MKKLILMLLITTSSMSFAGLNQDSAPVTSAEAVALTTQMDRLAGLLEADAKAREEAKANALTAKIGRGYDASKDAVVGAYHSTTGWTSAKVLTPTGNWFSSMSARAGHVFK